MDDVAAILLAAGQSRRMGEFKPLLPFGDRTVIETCIDNLREAGIQDIVVVLGHRAEDIRRQLQHRNLIFALNSDPDSEMGVSIARGMEQIGLGSKAVLIALVDYPGVPPEVTRVLIDEWGRTQAKLVQPEYQGRGGHPVLIDLIYRKELLDLDPNRGMRAMLDNHRAALLRIPVDSPFVVKDMDTWEDYRQLHQDVFGCLPPRREDPVQTV
jgi:molybdenum cofactor cytidylyltransferase